MNIPGLGVVTKSTKYRWYYSEKIPVRVLKGTQCRIIIKGYDEDSHKADFHVAIQNFLAADEGVLLAVEPDIYQYYLDCKDFFDPDDDLDIKTASDIWKHIRLGGEPVFSRRVRGDKGIYVSLECGCEWEPEHGLEIVFKNGLKVNMVGPYSGIVTNSDAYGDDRLEHVIYHRVGTNRRNW